MPPSATTARAARCGESEDSSGPPKSTATHVASTQRLALPRLPNDAPLCIQRIGRSLQHRLAPRPTLAGEPRHAVGHVVVRQFLSLADVPRCDDPDRVIDDVRVAVRLARMVDVSRHVPPDGRVAHVEPVEPEAPDMAVARVAPLALEALLVWDLLAVIGDDSLVLVDGLRRENAPAFDLRFATFDHGC